MGLLKQSLAIVGGAGKGTAEVAKQIGLEQVFGQGGAVYRYEAVSVSDGVSLVQRTSDELLARAALAEKEDVDRQAEHPRQVIDDAAQAILAAHEVDDRAAESGAVVVRVFTSINMTLPVPSFKPHLFRHRMVCWHTRHGLIVGQYWGDLYGTGRHLAWRDTTPVGPGWYGDR